MALSNIYREPRREITESVLGILVFSIFVFADYHFATWFHEFSGGARVGCPVPLGFVIGLFALFALVLLLYITHWFGESVCDFLADRGLELRPKIRRR